MDFNIVRIESQNIGSNAFPTYFVDLVNVRDAESVSTLLLKTEDKEEARTFSRAYADSNGVRIEDHTMVAEAVAAFKARGYVAEAKYKAASDFVLEAAICREAAAQCRLCNGTAIMFNAPCVDGCGGLPSALPATSV